MKKEKQSDKIHFQDLFLEKVITEYDNYLWQKGKPNTNKEKASLRKSLIVKKLKDTKQDKESVRKYFDHKLEELVNKSEHQNLEDLLTSYYIMYELQMNHQQ